MKWIKSTNHVCVRLTVEHSSDFRNAPVNSVMKNNFEVGLDAVDFLKDLSQKMHL